MYEKIKNGYYNVVERPKLPIKPKLVGDHTPKSVRKYADELYRYEREREKFNEEMKSYRKNTKEKIEEFKKDAMEYVGLTNHPKADKIFSKAWENGHSEGLYMILQELEELSELVN